MTHDRHPPFQQRSSTRQFLLYHAELSGPKVITGKIATLPEDALTKKFPDLKNGLAFVESTLTILEAHLNFSALAIRLKIDTQGPHADQPSNLETVRIAVAKTIETISQSQESYWGVLDDMTFGLFLPGREISHCEQVARRIHQSLENVPAAEAIVGIAIYPTINFSRDQIMANACKAIDHAAFFGPGSTVFFDAVTLNISGDQLYKKGDIVNAIKEFKTGLMLDPSNVNLHNSLGVCYAVMGENDIAAEAFEAARWLDSSDVMAPYNLGLLQLVKGDSKKALTFFLEAQAVDDAVYEVNFQLGRIFFDEGNLSKAMLHFNKAVGINAQSGAAHRYLGKCHEKRNDFDTAIEAYRSAVKENPNDAESLSALGHLFSREEKDLEIARVFCEQSVQLSPANGQYRLRLGKLYIKSNHLTEALHEFQEAERLGQKAAEHIKAVKKALKAKPN
jgi:tetratricopeptide (TPR) repeat protein